MLAAQSPPPPQKNTHTHTHLNNPPPFPNKTLQQEQSAKYADSLKDFALPGGGGGRFTNVRLLRLEPYDSELRPRSHESLMKVRGSGAVGGCVRMWEGKKEGWGWGWVGAGRSHESLMKVSRWERKRERRGLFGGGGLLALAWVAHEGRWGSWCWCRRATQTNDKQTNITHTTTFLPYFLPSSLPQDILAEPRARATPPTTSSVRARFFSLFYVYHDAATCVKRFCFHMHACMRACSCAFIVSFRQSVI